jgi:hypothetical protein
MVALSSLARSCSTWFSDICGVELSEGTEPIFRVCFPMGGEAGAAAGAASLDDIAVSSMPAGRIVATPFHAPSSHGYAAFAGVFTCGWADRVPAEADVIIARLLVEGTMGIIGRQRAIEAAARAEARAAKLAVDLISARREGEGTGVLMATLHVSRAEALLMLRKQNGTSQLRLV